MSKQNSTAPVGSGALFGFFKVRPCQNGESRFIAWGALERLTADDSITEPAEPVHFQFATTEDEAVQKLTYEMDAAYGKRRWWRQHCNPNAEHEPPEPAASDAETATGLHRWLRSAPCSC